ncbi:phosphopentomutase [Fuchsiella alkaliacetigena]|uniref:phosphopentomutase n=1 Tax=Fuchsiella alkaliacetigena TaxID=957042 RepID=UPI00200A13E8|nr:phosphopentomutase [Fuchsiella alkaliacetigena]MCK8824757.1 phosphopentomutase [Fuchsiella alkaliacetigena]
MKIKRVLIIVLDSLGVGALPDAKQFGDEGASTLPNIARELGGIELPNLERLGLGNIAGVEIKGVNQLSKAEGVYAKMAEASPGKDTTMGHWELAGIISEQPFPTYPDGFPEEIIKEFEEAIGTEILGNYAASGTVIIEELGVEHLATGQPIVYTSADSVFQIAAHEDVISVEELYSYCRKAREILKGEHAVARVIARPFKGELGSLVRTASRKDFSLVPPKPTLLDSVKEAGQTVLGIGKIDNIFADRGLTDSKHIAGNQEGIETICDSLTEVEAGLIFANLVDFDQLYGHRNDVQGYAQALQEFDSQLPEIEALLEEDDLLIITADHGCDPTYPGTDHTREYVPLLIKGAAIKAGVDLGIRDSFADLASTVADILEVKEPEDGSSFKEQIMD